MRYMLVFALLFMPLTAQALTLDFEDLPDLTPVTTQYAALGIVFSGATIFTAGISLPEAEFPPYSGSNVVFDDDGPITVSLTAPIQGFSAYFTHMVPLNLSFYDASDTSIGMVSSSYSSNLALSGDPGSFPNELLSFASNAGISRVVITGDTSGGSFVMDDLTVASSVPEPSTLALSAVTWIILLCYVTRRRLSGHAVNAIIG